MSKLPPPSDTPDVFLNIGTLSGLNVLTVGSVEPGATVELKDGSIGVVVNVKRSAEHPDCSNREIAGAIGVSNQPQISRLLSQLAEDDLAVKRSAGAGKRNEWRASTRGEEIARALQQKGG